MAKPRGRPRKPLEEHEAHGTLRRDRHGDAALKFRPDGDAQKPEHLKDHAEWLWDFIVAELRRKNVAHRIDTPMLTAACEWYGRYRKAGEVLDGMSPTDGDYYRLAITTNMAWKAFDGLASQFGLSPTARMKLQIQEQTKTEGVMTRKRA